MQGTVSTALKKHKQLQHTCRVTGRGGITTFDMRPSSLNRFPHVKIKVLGFSIQEGDGKTPSILGIRSPRLSEEIN